MARLEEAPAPVGLSVLASNGCECEISVSSNNEMGIWLIYTNSCMLRQRIFMHHPPSFHRAKILFEMPVKLLFR